MQKKNVWEDILPILRQVFPYPYPEKDWEGNPIEEDERDDYYESEKDPLIPFLVNGEIRTCDEVGLAVNNIEFVEFEGSFYENVDYDSIPQGTEDECKGVIKIGNQFYKFGLIYTSWSGYRLDEWAMKVNPKTVEIVVYE